MNKLKFRATAAAAALAISMVAVGMSPPIAGASSNYSHAVYQITFSLNCNNPSAPCQNIFGLGGLWGWAALSSSGGANVQVTDCGHSLVAPGQAGASHTSLDTTWIQFYSPSAPTPVTPIDPNHLYLHILNSPIPPVPATYGHYSFSYATGPLAGAFGQITVAP